MERTHLPESNWQTRPARILRTRQMTEHEKLFEISLGGGRTLDYEPGQFVMLSLFGVGEIPISVASSPTQRASFEICVRAVGKVTRALHRLEAGDELGVRGPYGHGFPIRILEGNDLLVIAGGLGIAPLRSLIRYVLDKSHDIVAPTLGSKLSGNLMTKSGSLRLPSSSRNAVWAS